MVPALRHIRFIIVGGRESVFVTEKRWAFYLQLPLHVYEWIGYECLVLRRRGQMHVLISHTASVSVVFIMWDVFLCRTWPGTMDLSVGTERIV